MNFFNLVIIDESIVLACLGATLILALIGFIIAIVACAKASKLRKKYEAFMAGEDGKSIEELIKSNLSDVNAIKKVTNENMASIEDLYDKLQFTFQKVGLIKYDAFHEMGGKLSFALCMLDKNNTGVLLNVMHSNTGCFAYVKEIVQGKAFLELGNEEEQALNEAVAGKRGSVDFEPEYNEILNK